MERSFKEYIANPLGNKNTVFSSREMYKNMYTNKFNLLMVRENSKIEYHLYKDDSNFYIHLKIPILYNQFNYIITEIYIIIRFKLNIQKMPKKFGVNTK